MFSKNLSFRQNSPAKEPVRAIYVSDGSGRDSYILANNGGFDK